MNMGIQGSKIFIRNFEDTDAAALLDLHLRNKEFFQKYSPTYDNDYYTLDRQKKFIGDMVKQKGKGNEYCFLFPSKFITTVTLAKLYQKLHISFVVLWSGEI